jgi:branched-chain amino acid transport system substrate-binding protein
MANDRTEAIALLRKAAGDAQILAVVGPSSSVGFVPMVPVAGQLEMPVISVGAGAPLTEWNIFAYRTNPSGIEPVRATLKAVVPLVKAKRVAVIYESTQDAMVSDFNGVKTVAAELGYEVVANQSFKVGDQDFSAQITAVAAATPDLIYVAGSTEAAKVVQQIRAKGVTTAVAGGYGTLADTLIWDNSGGATKGAYTWLAQDFSKPSAPVGKLFTAYKQAYNDEGNANTMYGYDAVYAVAEAVKKSGSATDRKKLATALSSVDFTTPLGTRISWKNPPNGDLTNPSIGIYRVVERGVLERVDK